MQIGGYQDILGVLLSQRKKKKSKIGENKRMENLTNGLTAVIEKYILKKFI